MGFRSTDAVSVVVYCAYMTLLILIDDAMEISHHPSEVISIPVANKANFIGFNFVVVLDTHKPRRFYYNLPIYEG